MTGHDLGHAQRGGTDHLGVVRLASQFGEHPIGEARVSDPVGAQQCGQRGAALGQPACILHRRGRRGHGGQVDPVLHDLQAGVDVAVDARSQQGEDRLVLAKLRDLPEYHLVDLRGHFGGPTGHRGRDLGHQLGDCGTIHIHPRILSYSPELATPAAIVPSNAATGTITFP